MPAEDTAPAEPRLISRLLALARTLRARGLPVGTSDLLLGLQAVAVVGVEDRSDLAAALRACWCRQSSDLALFDQAFAAAFSPSEREPVRLSQPTARVTVAAPVLAPGDG
ncbi:MAG: hypothetical protein WBU92_01685, partial [Candidatus Dormiibacterota bacterium]